MENGSQDTADDLFLQPWRRPHDIARAFKAADWVLPCICVGVLALIARHHPEAGQREIAARVRKARALVSRLLGFAPCDASDEDALRKLRGRGGRGALVSRAVH